MPSRKSLPPGAARIMPIGARIRLVEAALDARKTHFSHMSCRTVSLAAPSKLQLLTTSAMARPLALTVVRPQPPGIAGAGFRVRLAAKGWFSAIDGPRTAPAAGRPDPVLVPAGKPIPFLEAVVGGLPVGVAGNIRLAER